MRVVSKGTGITATTETLIDGPEDLQVLVDWSEDRKRKLIEGGEFGAATYDPVALCKGILNAAGRGPYIEDSPADLAKRILEYHADAKRFIVQGNADLAARFAFHAGDLFARADIKWAWERDAVRGRKAADALRMAARSGNNSRRQARAPDFKAWNEEANRIWAQSPSRLSKHRVAELVRDRLQLVEKVDTIARRLKNVGKAR
ncbi:hypothetical protein NKJ40_17200 [Mesorhizobium sp. M0119]|uniref:hypothetical protein n=1 Tax=Mesorhizobium sp. M0119 TaxID=2956885 RepID=UPI00333807E2